MALQISACCGHMANITSPLANASTTMYIPLGKVDLYLEVLGKVLVDINL